MGAERIVQYFVNIAGCSVEGVCVKERDGVDISHPIQSLFPKEFQGMDLALRSTLQREVGVVDRIDFEKQKEKGECCIGYLE